MQLYHYGARKILRKKSIIKYVRLWRRIAGSIGSVSMDEYLETMLDTALAASEIV